MNIGISIIIPACGRADLLDQCLRSILPQLTSSDEVIISDDGCEVNESNLIQSNPQICYRFNQHPLGQSANVNSLIDSASREYTILIHDDDLLIFNGLDILRKTIIENPSVCAAFGQQLVATPDGKISTEDSENLNRAFFRSAEHAKKQFSNFERGAIGQFPNNGFIIKTDLAKSLKYRTSSDIGDACDYDFGLRVGLNAREIVFMPQPVSIYRLHQKSISHKPKNDAAACAYLLLRKECEKQIVTAPVKHFLRSKAPLALQQACKLNRLADARLIYEDIYFRDNFPSIQFLKAFLKYNLKRLT